MCGIAGIISTQNNYVQFNHLKKMTDSLVHRGPDADGFWINENKNIGFGHRRLSIIDLSEQANQPFQYQHCTIIYNGEIYNYVELKDFLSKKGFNFSTQSDTEVILAAYIFWGKECLNEFDGMFAFSIYDSQLNEVFLARDRFGEKPLYYSTITDKGNTHFHFASEIKALFSIGINKEIQNQQLLNYLTLGFTSNPIDKSQTFFKNISSLPPAHYISLNISSNTMHQKRWYILEKKEVLKKNDGVLIEQFSSLFQSSIKNRLRSDVSIGTSLSGGLDSSSIVAKIHQVQNKTQYQSTTFTASFPGFEKDETQYSKQVSQQFNLTQNFITPTASDFINEFEKLMYHQEQPIQSSSVFTQFMVYQKAKEKNVSVLIDGQGADEILGGYTKYSHWFLQ